MPTLVRCIPLCGVHDSVVEKTQAPCREFSRTTELPPCFTTSHRRSCEHACRLQATPHAVVWMVRTVPQRLSTTRHCSNSFTDKTFADWGGDVPPPQDLHGQWHGPCFSSSIGLGTCGSQGCSPRAWSRAGTSAQEGGRPHDYDTRTESHSGIDLTGDGGDRV